MERFCHQHYIHLNTVLENGKKKKLTRREKRKLKKEQSYDLKEQSHGLKNSENGQLQYHKAKTVKKDTAIGPIEQELFYDR